jgi:hypothetical protein
VSHLKIEAEIRKLHLIIKSNDFEAVAAASPPSVAAFTTLATDVGSKLLRPDMTFEIQNIDYGRVRDSRNLHSQTEIQKPLTPISGGTVA